MNLDTAGRSPIRRGPVGSTVHGLDVLRRANRLPEPQQEQSCALADGPVGEPGLRNAIQHALAAEAGKRELVLDAELTASLDESRLYPRRRHSWDRRASHDDR